MATIKKKSRLTLPPTPEAIDDKAMKAMIDKGGSSSAKGNPEPTGDKLKSFTFKIYESELASIRTIVGLLPKHDRQSIHSFALAAVQKK